MIKVTVSYEFPDRAPQEADMDRFEEELDKTPLRTIEITWDGHTVIVEDIKINELDPLFVLLEKWTKELAT